MIAGKWFITSHAVRRYIERVDRAASYEHAMAELIRWSEKARAVKEIYPGVWLCRGNKPLRLRFYVAMSPMTIDGRPGFPQLLTIMAGHDRFYRRIG